MRRRGVNVVDLDDARKALEAIRRGLPSLPREPDRPPGSRPPELTPRQREVLIALARPLAGVDTSARPLTSDEVAAELSIPTEVVEKELKAISETLAIGGGDPERLVREAIHRRLISRSDLLA